MRLLVLLYRFTLALATPMGAAADTPPDYLEYHRKVQEAEKQLVAGDYEGASG